MVLLSVLKTVFQRHFTALPIHKIPTMGFNPTCGKPYSLLSHYPLPLNMLLSKNLDILIRSKKLTVASLARATKVPVQTIHNWLNGCNPANLEHLKSVSDYLNTTVDELCFSENPCSGQNIVDDYKEEINAGIFEVILRRIKQPK